MQLAVGVLACLLAGANAFYLPGVSPHAYEAGEQVRLQVNSLTSVKTHLPYEFYNLKYCRPDVIREAPENLGQLLMGNDILNSAFQIRMGSEETCALLCKQSLNKDDVEAFVSAIDDEYVVNWIVDNLPAAVQVHVPDTDATYKLYERGFPVGNVEKGEADETPRNYYIHNHFNLKIMTHSSEEFSGFRIVGFEVEPLSVDHLDTMKDSTDSLPPTLPTTQCDTQAIVSGMRRPMYVRGESARPNDKSEIEVVFTYSVKFEGSDISWASRWDIYLSMNDRYSDDVHWFSIINSLAIVFFLTGMIALIMTRTVYKDVRRYNRVPTAEELEEEREETGWKLVHADVFRPPSTMPILLSSMVGTGTQLVVMAVAVLVFAALGFLSPANRGSLMIALLLQFVLMGIVAGYVSARIYKLFYGTHWQRCTLVTSLGFPGIAFSIFFLLNLLVWSRGSTGAVPFGSMFSIMLLWFGVSVPLVFFGAYQGYRRDRIETPTATSSIPRQIPPQPWYMQPSVTALVGGVLPFSAVFVELYFVLTSIWLDQYYYVFGFLALVFLILFLTCIEISIVLCYFQLCAEDYRWAWRSFITPGTSALYLFTYSIYYYAAKMDMDAFVPSVLYFGYMALIAVAFFLLTGCVGFLATLWFNIKIFGSIKVE